jgi:hypothetical protein
MFRIRGILVVDRLFTGGSGKPARFFFFARFFGFFFFARTTSIVPFLFRRIISARTNLPVGRGFFLNETSGGARFSFSPQRAFRESVSVSLEFLRASSFPGSACPARSARSQSSHA